MKIHEFDSINDRKARRFKEKEISSKIERASKFEAEHEIEVENETQNNLNLLD
jgi:hypothetical protein